MLRTIFSPDNPVWRFFILVGRIWWLNILWLVCSLPIFTIGASTTALIYSCMKLKKDEGYPTENFFKSFKRLCTHYHIPVIRCYFKFTFAVFTDICYTFGSIIVLYQYPCRPCFPYAQHSDYRLNTSRKIYKYKILSAYAFCF